MAIIREILAAEDRFSAVFSRFLSMGQRMASGMTAVGTAQENYNRTVAESGSALSEMADTASDTASKLDGINSKTEKMAGASRNAANGQERMNRAMRNGANAADGLIAKLKTLAVTYLGLRSAQKFAGLSDTWTQTTARLDRMNDRRQSTPEVQDMIYQAAQRSRGDYQDTADMTAKLGTLAGDAFHSTEEVVAFVEQINKQFALAGTSAQGAQAAMLQLTQAMSSGVLRGEELNSVLEQAPTITKSIAEYMGVTIGELRELASEGAVTADVVKAALFAAADETNKAFESIPLTFSQAWTMVKNEALNAFRPALEQLNNLLNSDVGQAAINGLITGVRLLGDAVVWVIGLVETAAEWVMSNWETISTVLISGAVAIGAVMMASAVQSAVAWAAANLPLVLMIGTITLVIYMARQMGATWEDICGVIGGVLYELYAFGYNLVADAWNLIATFAEFFANVFHDPVTAIAHLFADLADWVLDILRTLASAIDAVFGSNLAGAVNGWRSNVQNWANSFGENQITVQRMEKIQYDDAWDKGTNAGKNVGATIDSFKLPDYLSNIGGTPFDYTAMLETSGVPAALDDIGKDTKAIKNSVALSEEDIKLLVDLAERDYITNVNLTAQTPIINVSGQNTGNNELDRQQLAEAIKMILLEESASHTALSYT